MQHVDILRLHRVASALAVGALGSGRGEEANIDILVLHQLLKRRQDIALDELLALGRALSRGSASFLLELNKSRSTVVRDSAKDVNEYGV